MTSLWQLVKGAIPQDHARQTNAIDLLRSQLSGADAPATVLDLGCGDGRTAALAREVKPDVSWIGLDIEESTLARAITGETVHLYDGEHFPFESGSIPLIYSQQVFEHVRHPEQVLSEIARVLTPGGVLIGSTSHLEPYHAHSLWNYTPYGFKVLVEAAGLELLELRPSIDGIALVTRTHEGRLPEHSRWWTGESPLNEKISAWGEETGASVAQVNHRKLAVCGQFCFRVRKPAGWQGPDRRPTWPQVRASTAQVAGDAGHLVAEQLRSASRSPGLRSAAKKVPGARRAAKALRSAQAARARRG